MIFELRQYPLRPGTAAGFVDLFDTHFVESQREVGIDVVGTFLDRDVPDRFVWLRAFPDVARRRASLEAFYLTPAPAWRDHGAAANAAIADSDDVLLLRPVGGWTPPTGAIGTPDVTITVWPGAVDLDVPHLVSAEVANDVPALPVRLDRVTVAIGPHPPVTAAPLQVLRLVPTPRSVLR